MVGEQGPLWPKLIKNNYQGGNHGRKKSNFTFIRKLYFIFNSTTRNANILLFVYIYLYANKILMQNCK